VLVEGLTAIALMAIIFGMPVAIIATILRYRLKAKELDIQRIDAERRLLEAKALGDVPDFIDQNDPAAVDEWRRAKRELDRETARRAALSQVMSERSL